MRNPSSFVTVQLRLVKETQYLMKKLSLFFKKSIHNKRNCNIRSWDNISETLLQEFAEVEHFCIFCIGVPFEYVVFSCKMHEKTTYSISYIAVHPSSLAHID
jgi:hypothetical protein